MENLLYYPYINIPKGAWAARALLYYNKIGSIIPQRYYFQDYDPFMRELVENKLVQIINPLIILNHPWQITTPFIDYIFSKGVDLNRRRISFRNGAYGRVHQDKFKLNGPRIHADKFDGEIFNQLEQAGLAIKQDNEWYIVERTTANELMTFLASVIGGKLEFLPATDQEPKMLKLAGTKKEFEDHKVMNKKRELILNELIPFPEEINLPELRKFKDDHYDLLKAFKNRVELIVLNKNMEVDTPLFRESINELKIRSEELSVKMSENKLGQIFFGTICGIIGAGIGLATTGSVKGTLLGLPGFANAVYSALQIEKAENIFDQSGLKYLALIDKHFKKTEN
jgi:hypothetical protein